MSDDVEGIAELLILIEEHSSGHSVGRMRSHGSPFSAEYAALGAIPVVISVNVELRSSGAGAVLPRGQIQELSLSDGPVTGSTRSDIVGLIHSLDRWAERRVTDRYLALYRPFAEQRAKLRSGR